MKRTVANWTTTFAAWARPDSPHLPAYWSGTCASLGARLSPMSLEPNLKQSCMGARIPRARAYPTPAMYADIDYTADLPGSASAS